MGCTHRRSTTDRAGTDRSGDPFANNALPKQNRAKIRSNCRSQKIGRRIRQSPLRELLQLHIRLRVDSACRRHRKAVATKLLLRLRDLPRRNPVHLHLHQRGNEWLFGLLVAFEQTGAEKTVPILRNPTLDPTDPLRQRLIIVAGTVAQPIKGPLAPKASAQAPRPAVPTLGGACPHSRTPLDPAGSSFVQCSGKPAASAQSS